MVFSDEDIETIEHMAAVNYGPDKIALYLQVDKKQFREQWNDKESEIRQAYDRGQLQAEYLINKKQLDLAQSGNITAAQIFLKEAERTRIENLRNRILFGDETD